MMDSFQRRRVVSATTSFLVAKEAATPTAATKTANPTIAPFYTNLAGVDQPVNLLLADILWWSIGIVGFLILGIRIIELLWGKLRQVSAMSVPGDKQAYWKSSQWSWMPGVKKYLIYAPLWKKRHNREIRLSSAINMGTLPSRLHFILLFLYVGSNFAYMFILNWDNKNKWSFMAEIRGRSGTIAAFNMVPLIIFAGRNNPLIGILSISFDTYNLFHRWIGRVAVAEAVIHTVAWAVVAHADGGWDLIWEKVQFDSFIASGTAATIAMVILLILSLSSLRHAFYETFLNIHIILAFVTIIGTYIHCITATIPGVGGLPQVTMVIAILALWFADRLARMMRIVYYNWSSRGMTEAIVEPMPGEAVRVTMHLPRHVDVKPGSHAYLRFSQANWWECHPFSIAWTEHKTETKGRLPVTEKDATKERKVSTSVSFIIGAHTGMTRKLYNVALKSGERAIAMRAAFEGPYAGHHSLDSYGHAVLFAGSTGITHQISFLKPLIEGYNSGRVATRKITLVWIVRDYESLEWVKPWMNEVLRMPNRRDILRIKLFVTRPKNPRVISSPSETVEMLAGRPNVSTILNKECANQIGAMCVTVCGPGALADDVRQAVRGVQDGDNVVDFIEESFTW